MRKPSSIYACNQANSWLSDTIVTADKWYHANSWSSDTMVTADQVIPWWQLIKWYHGDIWSSDTMWQLIKWYYVTADQVIPWWQLIKWYHGDQVIPWWQLTKWYHGDSWSIHATDHAQILIVEMPNTNMFQYLNICHLDDVLRALRYTDLNICCLFALLYTLVDDSEYPWMLPTERQWILCIDSSQSQAFCKMFNFENALGDKHFTSIFVSMNDNSLVILLLEVL